MYKKIFKRLLDIFCSALFLLIFWWLYAILAILVRTKLGSPVIFRQQRPGLNAEPFDMIKFRTMTDERDENGELLPDEVRLTKFGRFLRSTSLDELPEIWLIFTGKMSIVGERDIIVTTKKNLIFQGLSRLIQFRYKVLYDDWNRLLGSL